MTAHSRFDLLTGSGEMRARMRSHDWNNSPLGPPGTWPSSLRTAVGIMLSSSFPMFLAWGPSLTFLCHEFNLQAAFAASRSCRSEPSRSQSSAWLCTERSET